MLTREEIEAIRDCAAEGHDPPTLMPASWVDLCETALAYLDRAEARGQKIDRLVETLDEISDREVDLLDHVARLERDLGCATGEFRGDGWSVWVGSDGLWYSSVGGTLTVHDTRDEALAAARGES